MALNMSLLYPPNYDKASEIQMKDYKFIHSLQVDEMVVLIKESYRGFSDLALENFFTTNPEVLRYRIAVVKDLVENDELYQVFCKAVQIIYNLSDVRRVLNSEFTKESALGSIRYLEMYQEIVNLFADSLKKCTLHSEGMNEFKSQILAIAESEEYKNLDEELSKMEINFGYVRSVTIGVNLDANLRPTHGGIVSVNKSYFHPGSIMDKLLKKNTDEYVLLSSLYPLAKGLHGDEMRAIQSSINNSLHTIFAKSLRDFEPMIQKYFNINTSVFVSLLDDIRFLTAGVGFIRSMKEKGFTMCCPEIAEIAELAEIAEISELEEIA